MNVFNKATPEQAKFFQELFGFTDEAVADLNVFEVSPAICSAVWEVDDAETPKEMKEELASPFRIFFVELCDGSINMGDTNPHAATPKLRSDLFWPPSRAAHVKELLSRLNVDDDILWYTFLLTIYGMNG